MGRFALDIHEGIKNLLELVDSMLYNNKWVINIIFKNSGIF